MCNAGLMCPCLCFYSLEVAGSVRATERAEPTGMERAGVEVMAGDTVDRPARQEIDASRDSDHTHLHLLMTLSFGSLTFSSPSIPVQTAKY